MIKCSLLYISISLWVLRTPNACQNDCFLQKIWCKFLAFFKKKQVKTLKIVISTSFWSAQHPNTGRNIQQLPEKLQFRIKIWFKIWEYWLNYWHICAGRSGFTSNTDFESMLRQKLQWPLGLTWEGCLPPWLLVLSDSLPLGWLDFAFVLHFVFCQQEIPRLFCYMIKFSLKCFTTIAFIQFN